MSHHPAPDSFERYVTGALPADQAEALERHTVECSTCAARLTREARIEAALFETAGALAAHDSRRTVRRVRLRRLAPVLAAAAAVAALKVVWPARHASAPQAPVVASRDLLGTRVDAIALDDLDARMDSDDSEPVRMSQ